MSETVGVTEADIESTSRKLDEFATQLSASEQAVLARILQRAAAASASEPADDTQGYIIIVGGKFSSSPIIFRSYGLYYSVPTSPQVGLRPHVSQ